MSFVFSCFHIVFSTKGRLSHVHPDRKEDLISYINGVCRKKGITLIEGNAMEEHVHLLVLLPSSLSLSQAVNAIKSNSSRWAKTNLHEFFTWQGEYGAFSVSKSRVAFTQKYIQNQESHHGKLSFKSEFEELLKKHEIDLNQQYLWDDS